jgi:integrase
MAAAMEKTRYAGVFRRGSRYVAVWRAGGRQHKRSASTLEAARKLRAAMQADVARGEFDPQSALTFREYAAEWVERYHGKGRRGFRQNTRDDYRRHLERFAYPWFGGEVVYPQAPSRPVTLSQLRPPDVARFVRWLADATAQADHERELAAREVREAERRLQRADGDAARRDARKQLAGARRRLRRASDVEAKPLADATIRNVLCPVRACLGTAVEEELIRHNPTVKVAVPRRERADDEHEDDDEQEVRVLTRAELAMVLAVLPERHRLLFRFLAATGLRISELIALQWKHLVLDGSTPHVKVRRAIVRGRLGRVKSRFGKREVRLPFELVSELRRHRTDSEWPGDDDPVFLSLTGTPLDPGNLRRRVLAPAAEEAEVAWCGLHTFRHTCASLLFAAGRNVVQVQRWLGHHKPSFTLDTYVHLFPDDLGEPLDLAAELAQGGNRVASRPVSAGLNGHRPDPGDSAQEAGFASLADAGLEPAKGS